MSLSPTARKLTPVRLEEPCVAHGSHWPRNLTIEFHHVLPVSWQLSTPVSAPPFPGRDRDGRGELWDARGVWLCPTGHRSVHALIVRYMHGAIDMQPTAVGAVIASGAVTVPLRDRAREITGLALVDSDVAPMVLKYNWTLQPRGNTAYAGARIQGRKTYLHRFLANPAPGMHVHHRNREGLDCRSANLQVLTPQQHADLVGPYLNAAHVTRQAGRYRAYVTDAGRRVDLGMYASEDEANAVAEDAVWELYFAIEDGPERPLLAEAAIALMALERYQPYGSLLALTAAGEWGQS